MDRLTKIGRIVAKVIVVLRILLIVGVAILAFASVAGIAAAPWLVNQLTSSSSSVTISSGPLKLTIDPSALALTVSNLRWLIVLLLALVAVVTALTLRMMSLLIRIMEQMGAGHPFSPVMTKLIRELGVLVIVYGFVTPVVPMILAGYAINGLQIPGGWLGGQVQWAYNANGLAIIAGLLVLLLSLVFDYGAQLQKQADETL